MTGQRRIQILTALLLAGVALTHVLQARHEEARYIVVLFGLLAAAALVPASLLALGRAGGFAPSAAFGLCLAAIAGYVVSRTAGLPQMDDDISNWTDPLGIAALACELGVVGLAFQQALQVVQRLVGFTFRGALEGAIGQERAERAAG
jgi:H+/Cl- antiporter ClcA